MVFKDWTKKEFDTFCDDNFIVDEDGEATAIWQLIHKFNRVSLSIENGRKMEDGNTEGIVVIKIGEVDE
jgi:hypothetical protein